MADKSDQAVKAGRPKPRRRPQMVPFLLTGIVLGLVAGGLVGFMGPSAPLTGTSQETIVMAGCGGVVGVLVAALIFLAVERRTRPEE